MNDDTKGGANPRRKAKNVAIVIYVAFIVLSALVLLPSLWYLWLLVVAVCLFRIILLALPRTFYQCQECGESFQWARRRASLRPTTADLYGTNDAPKCPKCGSRSVIKVKRR